MLLRTRIIIVISTVIIGIFTILCLTVYLVFGINRLNRVDATCNNTINTLKQLQLTTAQLLTTHELDNTFLKWQHVYQGFQHELDRLNTSPEIHAFLVAQDKQSIIESLNMFWTYTKKRTKQVERDLTGLLSRPNRSRDGLIYQYAETRDHELLMTRNTIYSALLFLEAEFQTRLSNLIDIVDQEKTDRFNHLIFQITGVGLTIALIVGTVLVSFMNRLRSNLDHLNQAMDVIGKGDFTRKIQVSGNDELSQIGRVINTTTDALGDIHEELERRLHEISLAKEKAEAASRSKTIFLANMSHEIRTPLNAVLGFSELLSGLVKDDEQKSYLSAIQSAGKTLLTLISDILDLSKIEADKIELQYVPCDIRALVREVEQIFAGQASKKNIQFYNDIDEILPRTILIDKTRLRQILLNIVGNAVKFTHHGHIRLSVDIRSHEDDSLFDLHLSVTDTGIGIPDHEIDRIFESFEQQAGQDLSVYGGTGLGLTISKRLVEMLNGRIWVESHVNRGSTFHILIPDMESAPDDRAVIDESFDPLQFPFEKGRVLVVDDVASHRNLLCSLLGQVGLETETAENGEAAIEMAKSRHPDIILMDIRMPVMDGVSATRRLKADPDTARIPIIALTASSAHRDMNEILTKGFNGFFPKPIEIRQLMNELARYLPLRAKTAAVADQTGEADDRERLWAVLPGLIGRLESEFMKNWESFREHQPMDEVKTFAEKIKILGDTHRIEVLSGYGNTLITHVATFDVGNMQTAIDKFPEIIRKIKAMEGPNHDR